ncbi:MAG: hypothetical protein HQ579_02760 [Candidatus Omnitrophica bacterium]|nr:hypothetical protein [Candidatus Omnitrophota bacterium]
MNIVKVFPIIEEGEYRDGEYRIPMAKLEGGQLVNFHKYFCDKSNAEKWLIFYFDSTIRQLKDKLHQRSIQLSDLKSKTIASKGRKFRWIVEFSVDKTWVADGFDLTENRALSMLSNDLQSAYIDTELEVKILKSPNKQEILKEQGY